MPNEKLPLELKNYIFTFFGSRTLRHTTPMVSKEFYRLSIQESLRQLPSLPLLPAETQLETLVWLYLVTENEFSKTFWPSMLEALQKYIEEKKIGLEHRAIAMTIIIVLRQKGVTLEKGKETTNDKEALKKFSEHFHFVFKLLMSKNPFLACILLALVNKYQDNSLGLKQCLSQGLQFSHLVVNQAEPIRILSLAVNLLIDKNYVTKNFTALCNSLPKENSIFNTENEFLDVQYRICLIANNLTPTQVNPILEVLLRFLLDPSLQFVENKMNTSRNEINNSLAALWMKIDEEKAKEILDKLLIKANSKAKDNTEAAAAAATLKAIANEFSAKQITYLFPENPNLEQLRTAFFIELILKSGKHFPSLLKRKYLAIIIKDELIPEHFKIQVYAELFVAAKDEEIKEFVEYLFTRNSTRPALNHDITRALTKLRDHITPDQIKQFINLSLSVRPIKGLHLQSLMELWDKLTRDQAIMVYKKLCAATRLFKSSYENYKTIDPKKLNPDLIPKLTSSISMLVPLGAEISFYFYKAGYIEGIDPLFYMDIPKNMMPEDLAKPQQEVSRQDGDNSNLNVVDHLKEIGKKHYPDPIKVAKKVLLKHCQGKNSETLWDLKNQLVMHFDDPEISFLTGYTNSARLNEEPKEPQWQFKQQMYNCSKEWIECIKIIEEAINETEKQESKETGKCMLQ